jgi:hypothetical protein
MTNEPHLIPRIAIQSIGGGLLMMALFTLMWTGIAQEGLQNYDHHVTLILFSTLCLIFVTYGIRMLTSAHRYPKFTSEVDEAEGREIGKRFGIILGIEGTTIALSCTVLGFTGYPQFTLPAIALIVGLHFYPMAKLFNRKIDYFLASWTTILSLISIYFVFRGNYALPSIFSFLGIGVALATSAYGINMLIVGYQISEKKASRSS